MESLTALAQLGALCSQPLLALGGDVPDQRRCFLFGAISSGERPTRRYWVTHLLTVPSLFAAGAFGVLSGLTAKAGWFTSAASFEILNNRF